MDQKESFLSRAKNLFSVKSEVSSIEEELKVSKVLDKKSGFSSLSGSSVFNFDAKNEIFGEIRDKTIFNSAGKKRNQPAADSANTPNVFDSINLKDLGFNKSDMPPELGNNFDFTG